MSNSDNKSNTVNKRFHYKGIVHRKAESPQILQQLTNNGEELPLHQVKKILSISYDEKTTLELTAQFCLISQSEITQRIGMEFLYWNGFIEELKVLVGKNHQSGNSENRNWAKVYDIIVKRRDQRAPDPYAYLYKLKNLSVEEPELKVLCLFLKIYGHYELSEFGMIGHYTEQVEIYLENIEEPLLLEQFHIRWNELLLHYHWKRNELLMARKYGYKLLNECFSPIKLCNIHHSLAKTYLYENYHQAVYHAKEALKIAESYKNDYTINMIKNRTLPFLANYHGDLESVNTTDHAELAHFEIKKGNKKKAIEMLTAFDNPSPFQLYFLGLATENKDYLQISYDRFIQEQSDYFYARLPLEQLKAISQK